MADTKHPAIELADTIEQGRDVWSVRDAVAMLRAIPALEAELEQKSEAIQRLWKERDELRAEVADWKQRAATDEALRRDAAAEADRLRAEVARWSGHAAYFEAERNELRAEVESLRADAKRYRFLRDEHARVDPICHLSWKRNGRNGSEWVNTAKLDAEIDAALSNPAA